MKLALDLALWVAALEHGAKLKQSGERGGTARSRRRGGTSFIYAIAVVDAYRWARFRWEFFHRAPGPTGPS